MEKVEGESIRSPEQLNRDIEQVLLSCERVGEGGKAVVLKLSPDKVSPELNHTLETLNVRDQDDRAIKLFKLYLPNKGAFEYKMHQRVYDAFSKIPKNERGAFAHIPALSSSTEVNLGTEMKRELEAKFGVSIIGEKSQLIAMEYIDGEDLATIFYKWILENEQLFTAEVTDTMEFKELYREVAYALKFEILPDGEIDDPRVLELAEWKNSAQNTDRLYSYLRKHHFPMSPEIVSQIEKTINLIHEAHVFHGDAFERNVMIEGGSQAFRENQKPGPKQSYLIDFGESRDHDVEGVDDFAMIRRLKKLLISKEDEERLESEKQFIEIDKKAELLTSRKNWRDTCTAIARAAKENPDRGMTMAWSRTAGLGETSIDNFFIMMKSFLMDGLIEQDKLDAFVKTKKQQALSPYQRARIDECLRWLESKKSVL